MRRPTVSIALVIALAALAGCGQKGPLVRPTPRPVPGQPAPAAPVPAHSAPQPLAPTLPVPTPDDGGVG